MCYDAKLTVFMWQKMCVDLLPGLGFLKAPFLGFKINFLKGRFKFDMEVDGTSEACLSCTKRAHRWIIGQCDAFVLAIF